jgi:ArsR family transcriptional regulator
MFVNGLWDDVSVAIVELPLLPAALVLADDAAERFATVYRALGDPTRVRLLSLVAATPGGEACICDLTGAVSLAQPTVSHHMRVLRDAGLVHREQRGKWAYYSIDLPALEAAGRALLPLRTAQRSLK